MIIRVVTRSLLGLAARCSLAACCRVNDSTSTVDDRATGRPDTASASVQYLKNASAHQVVLNPDYSDLDCKIPLCASESRACVLTLSTQYNRIYIDACQLLTGNLRLSTMGSSVTVAITIYIPLHILVVS